MGKEKYDLLMGEMDNILETVEKFPGHLQKPVFDALHSALMDGIHGKGAGKSDIEDLQLSNGDSPSDKGDDEDRNYAEEIVKYAEDYNLSDRRKVNDMEFATFIAYYFIECAQGEDRVDAIDKGHLEKACDIVGRDIPADLNKTLHNAKTKRYLESKGKNSGKYSLAHAGRRYIKNTLLKSNS